MNKGETSQSIPLDLVIEILSRLPAKSIARFRGVSKLWASLLRRPYFTELFLTRQQARPRLFFAVERYTELSFYSTPQTLNPYRKSYHTTFHMKLSNEKTSKHFHCLTYGLISFGEMIISSNDYDSNSMHVICNPNTRQYVILPLHRMSYHNRSQGFLGFDPINKQFKVLYLVNCHLYHKILTLGTGKLSWRTIHCPFPHYIDSEGICINGVVYYSCNHNDGETRGIVCFNVRSEAFKYVAAECYFDQLINYKGKLGGVRLKKGGAGGVVLKLWVLEDVEKQKWLKYDYTLWDEDIVLNRKDRNIFVVGMTTTGEIVLSMKHTSTPFYVFYFNLERNTLHSVEIQGLGEYYDGNETVIAFVDHVKDLDITDAKQLKSNQVLKIIKKRPKPQKRPTNPSVKKSNRYIEIE